MSTPRARDVVLAALSVVLPPRDRPDIEDRADLIVAALREHGHLPTEQHVASLADVEDVARWLAAESRFARYITADGWRRIMQSDADVNVAATYANTHAFTDDERQAVGEAKSVLLRWHQQDGGRPSGG